MKNISRRDFLKGAIASSAGIAAANLLGGFTAFAEDAKEAPKTEAGVPEWLGTAPVISDSDCVETVDTEILVVGAGCSGLFATAAAAEAGAKVLLIERSARGMSIRCSALGAVGSKIQKEHGVDINKTDIINDMCHYVRSLSSTPCPASPPDIWDGPPATAPRQSICPRMPTPLIIRKASSMRT